MGVVYLARDPRLNRRVAVKTCALPEGVTEDLAREFHVRFVREARAAASLSHPGIVTIYDAGQDPDLSIPYIAMEFVHGQSLKQLMSRGGRLEPNWVFSFGAVLADALYVAHRAGIIHRDIKPANILLRKGDGAAKIADFGVVRLMTSELTQTGAAVGSPGYMSPEQVRSGNLDGRSDLFSLAVVLYEALCGQCPFGGEDPVSLAHSIAYDTQVPLSHLLQGCPPALDAFFDRALAKFPAERFEDGVSFGKAFVEAGRQPFTRPMDRTMLDTAPQEPAAEDSADEASAAEEPFAEESAPAAEVAGRSGRRGRRRLVFALSVVLAAMLAGAAYFRFARPGPAQAGDREARAQTPAPPGVLPHGPAGASSRPPAVETAAPTPAKPRPIHLSVPRGAEIHLTLSNPVGSSTSRAGDSFTASVADAVMAGDRVAIPAGSKVHGQVRTASPARRGLIKKAGSVSLSFEKVVTPSGNGAAISAGLTSLGGQSQQKSITIAGTRDAGAAIAATTRGKDVQLPAGSRLVVRLARSLTITVIP